MIGRIVEIAEDGRYLHAYRGFLIVECKGEEVGRVPLDDIAAVIGNAHGLIYSNNLLVALAEREVPFVLCGNNHKPVGMLWPLEGHHRQSARMDTQLAASLPLRKRLWQQVVRAKLCWQADTLAQTGQNPGLILGLLPKVRSGDPANIEAQAARRYWSRLLGKGFQRDTDGTGLNSLLNYGYTVLRAAVARGVIAAGLHPGLGLHHHNQYNTMRLVDDLMEPYRPCIDLAVWRLQQKESLELDADTKKHLAHVIYQDFTTDYGTTPLIAALQRLAFSLSQVYCKETSQLEIALPNRHDAVNDLPEWVSDDVDDGDVRPARGGGPRT